MNEVTIIKQYLLHLDIGVISYRDNSNYLTQQFQKKNLYLGFDSGILAHRVSINLQTKTYNPKPRRVKQRLRIE